MATSKSKSWRIIRLAIIFLVFVLLFVFLNRLFQPKYATELIEGSMIAQYYGENKDHEVIFIGDCEMYANFSPLVMYETQGIKAYVRGSSQQFIWQSYYILKETLKYEKPKVVVFSVNAVRYDKSSDKVKEEYNRLTIDQMRWSQEKIAIIKESMTADESFISYVFPILRYHSRYDKITSEDFAYFLRRKDNTFNGFLVNKEIKAVDNIPTAKRLPSYDFSQQSLSYLEMIYNLCKENGVELMLVKAPSLYPHWYQEYDQQIIDFAKNRDLVYYNMLDYVDEMAIDYQIDTYDAGLHLNLTGATKLSEYFAKLLKKHYDLKDYRGDPHYEQKLETYKAFIKN